MKKYNSIEEVNNDFNILEAKHFGIINSYITGVLKIDSVKDFEIFLFEMRDALYEMEVDDEHLLEIAKIKSKIQHYNTEILEDEELLDLAYRNQ